jgi:2-polyprenyl-3-methyl-5-hydroxy-6-metoxy-1,4-benzoquinol methylase
MFAAERLYRCSSCGLLFAPLHSPEDLEQLYDQSYFEEYASDGAYDRDEAQRRYEARIRVKLVRARVERGRLFEIGAAGGYFLDEARAAGFDVAGVEPGAAMAAAARDRLGLDVQTGVVEHADLPEEHYDVACAWHVIEHLNEPQRGLGRLRAALRPGGHLFVEVPNLESIYAQRWGKQWVNLDLPHHVGHYNRTALRELLTNSGFEVLATETYPALGYVRPARALHPVAVAGQAKELLLVRAVPRHAHPWKHELLRAIARRPA